MKASDSDNRQLRSLIIDDEPDLCMLVAHILRQKNILPDYATTLAGGKQFIDRENFDFIVLDNHLPDGKGVEFIRYIKDRLPLTKILMITAFLDIASDRKHLSDNGIDYFLLKPLDTHSINQAIDRLLDNAGDPNN